MNARSPGLILCLLAACAPLPPEPSQAGQLPQFTVLTAKPSIGTLDFTLTGAGHLEGEFTLQRELATTHPVLLSVVWVEPRVPNYAHTHQAPLLQAAQQRLASWEAKAGTHAFAAEVPTPAPASRRVVTACATGPDATTAMASLVVFVDANENGLLDLTSGAAIDRVLSSSDFPGLLVGDQLIRPMLEYFEVCGPGAFTPIAARQPLYDEPLLDLVSCTQEDRFSAGLACGSSYEAAPVRFFADRIDDRVMLSLSALKQHSFYVDGEYVGWFGPNRDSRIELPRLSVGQHRLRAETMAGAVWEASFTLPDRTWIKAARPAPPQHQYDIDFQEVAGASRYFANAGSDIGGQADGTLSPLRVVTYGEVTITAVFGDLPFRSTASANLRR